MRVGENVLEVVDPRGNVRGKGRADADIVLTNSPDRGAGVLGPARAALHLRDAASSTCRRAPATSARRSMPNCSIPTRVDYIYSRPQPEQLRAVARGCDGVSRRTWLRTTTTHGQDACRTSSGWRPARSTARSTRPRSCTIRSPSRRRAGTTPPANWNGRLDLHLRRRLHRRLVPAGQRHRRRDRRLHAAQRLRARLVVAQRLRQQLQRPDGGRDDDDGEGALHRGVRPAGAHAGLGLLGRLVRAAPDRDNYPGLLDGIIPGCSFPDVGFATITSSPTPGCSTTTSTRAGGAGLDATSRSGRSPASCVYNTAPNVAIGARRIDPRPGPRAAAARAGRAALRPGDQPDGVRCDVYDHTVNVYGSDPATGFARRPLDNVGIQYGLKVAQRRHASSVDQFLDLNEKIGGFDVDANIVPPAAHRRRPDRDARGVPDRAPHQRRRRARVDSRSSTSATTTTQVAGGRHPRALPLVLDARAAGRRPTAASTTT